MNTNDTKPGDLVRECYNGWPGRPAHLSSLVWCVLKTHDDGVVAEMHPNTKIFVWLKSWIRVSGK
jgi:hypothetical protein